VALVFYVRLIGLTAGTLVYLFLVALILGHRRPRLFERLLFLLVLALFLVYAAELLSANSALHYGSVPEPTRLFSDFLFSLGLLFLLPLAVQTHTEYIRQEQGGGGIRWLRALGILLYALPVGNLIAAALSMQRHPDFGFAGFVHSLGRLNGLGVLLTCLLAAPMQVGILKSANNPTERRLFRNLASTSCLLAIAMVFINVISPRVCLSTYVTLAELTGILPGAYLIYFGLKHNFLEFGAQRNLVYALSATFLALLYLALVRRVSGWLEPIMPPEATASILLFILIFLFEPLERAIGPALHRAFRERMARWQSLAVDLQQEARSGDVSRLIARAERRIREELGLAAVRLAVPRDLRAQPLESPGGLGHAVRVPLSASGTEIGILEAASTGSYLTGETTAALEFLAEQLPAMLDLCRLLEDKVRLERELAERERLALLGQMAASVSHNLRNPLGSMKTILQVQLENPELPASVRHDDALVLSEIDRMNAKLAQLLNFAKPSSDGKQVAAVALAKQTVELFRHDAERRNVILAFDAPREEISVFVAEEAISEALSNLIVNAIEAQPEGGRVHVALSRCGERLEICIEDTGPGISPELRAKMFQPFFTTKATGTGLGLAIVARRVSEMGGTISCESPLHGGRGTRFRITIPLAERTGASDPMGDNAGDHADDTHRG
jgi:signal transduction histidine kinase